MSEQDLPVATPVEQSVAPEQADSAIPTDAQQEVAVAIETIDPPQLSAEPVAPEATYPPAENPAVVIPDAPADASATVEASPSTEAAPVVADPVVEVPATAEVATQPTTDTPDIAVEAPPVTESIPSTEFTGILPAVEAAPEVTQPQVDVAPEVPAEVVATPEQAPTEAPTASPEDELAQLNAARQIVGLDPVTQLETPPADDQTSLLQTAVAQTPEDLKKFMVDNVKRSALTWFNSCVDKASSEHAARIANGELAADLPVTRGDIVDTVLLSIMEHHIVATRQTRALMMAMELEETIVGVSPDVATTEGALDTPLM